MTHYVLALLIGIIAGLRALTAPAAASWAARLSADKIGAGTFAFMSYPWTAWGLTFLAIGELFLDLLPSTPSRKVPWQFAARVLAGAWSGGVIGTLGGSVWGLGVGMLAGTLGAVIGTFVGAAVRGWLAAKFREDRPAALIEDVFAIGGAVLIVIVGFAR